MNSTEKQPTSHRPIRIGDAINQALEMAENNQFPALGIPSGLPNLDRLTRGWKEGELIIIGSRPSVGKTTLALTLARNAAVEFGAPTAYFSMEMPATLLTERLIVSESGIPIDKLWGMDKIEEQDWQQVESSLSRLSESPLYIDDTPGMSIGKLRARVKDLAFNHGVKLFFVDYFQLLLPDEVDSALPISREREEELRFLKEMALEFRIAVIALSQVRRPTRKAFVTPVYAELETYCPFADEYADQIILLHRSEQHVLCADGTEPIQLEVIKSNSGKTASLSCRFDRNRIRITDPNGSVLNNTNDMTKLHWSVTEPDLDEDTLR